MKRKNIIILMIFILFIVVAGCSQKEFNEKSFVEKIGEFEKDKIVTGDEALSSISQLHGKDIRIDKGYIAQYLNKNKEPVIIWLSISPSNKDAQELFQSMDSKISNTGAFTNRQEKDIKGIKTIYVYGMNMDNYYYVVDKRVFWFAIPGNNTVKDLEDFMNKLN